MPSLLVWIGTVCVHESSRHCKQIQQAAVLVQRLIQLHRLQVCYGGPVDDIAISVEMRSMQGAVKGALVGIPLRTHKHKVSALLTVILLRDPWIIGRARRGCRLSNALMLTWGDNTYRSTAKQNVHAIIALR